MRLATGDPAIAADVPVRLIGVPGDVDGVWVPRRVVHTLSPTRGCRTETDIEVVSPTSDMPSASLNSIRRTRPWSS